MLKWMKEKHCGQCASKNLQITKLQQALYEMAEDANKAEVYYKEKVEELRERLIKRKIDTTDGNYSRLIKALETIRHQREQINSLNRENARLKRKIDFIMDKPLPAELANDIDMRMLPQRVVNFLKNQKLLTYMDLVDKPEAEMLRTPNFGRKSLNQLRNHLREKFPKDQSHFACLAIWSD